MALININMTQEQVQEAINPAPADRYRLALQGFLADKDGSVEWRTKAGGTMFKAKLQIVSADPKQHGKGIIYNAVLGSFSFANLSKVFPIVVGSSVDTEAAIGMECEADVTVEEYTNPETGEKTYSNGIKKFYPAS